MNVVRQHSANVKGVSMVELLVAVTIIAVVILSLAAASLYSSRASTQSRIQLQATEFQQSEIERLLSLPYDSVITGQRSLNDGSSRWVVVDSFDFKQILVTTRYAPAQGISVVDTAVAYRLRG
jgi:type II secretory pathway pseudopilin PulG